MNTILPYTKNLIRRIQRFALPLVKIGLVNLFLSACASVPQTETTGERVMREAIEQKQQEPELQVPEEVTAALLPGNIAKSQLKAARPQVARFDISVNSAPARAFFLSLVADAGVNVVAHPEVSGEISLELKNVSVEEVLHVTREVYGYEYKYTKGIYTILPRKLRTEVFPVNYLYVQRVGVTDTSVQVGKIQSQRSNSGQAGGGNSNSSSANSDTANLLGYLNSQEGGSESSGSNGANGMTPGTRVQTLNRTDFWSRLESALSGIIGSGDGRLVLVNAQAGLVIVKALPREISSVRDFLERSELSVKRQVVLETKILEVRLNDSFQAGINWGEISGALSLEQTTSGVGDITNVIFGEKGITNSLFSSVLNVADITKLLSLLETQGNVQVLSSPRISTVNNQKAIIRVGSDEFFITGISNSTTSSAASIVNTPNVEFGSFFSGISLDVTPQISEEGDVILHVHPLVSKVKDQIKEFKIGSDNFSIPLALRDVRESDSIVRAKSGQIVVLGGLMQETTSDVGGERPVLGKIPIVNALFKTKSKSISKTELVILMRPIFVGDNTWEKELLKGSSRVKLLSDEYRAR